MAHTFSLSSTSSNPIEQVRAAKARYCRFVDTKQWENFSALLVANPQILVYDAAGQLIFTFDSREVYVDACRDYLEGAQSSHQVHNDELAQVSETEIQAIWSMEDCVIFPEADINVDPRPARHHGYGHYHESWVLEDGAWHLARVELRRTILEITPK
jgi:hypothetical protein